MEKALIKYEYNRIIIYIFKLLLIILILILILILKELKEIYLLIETIGKLNIEELIAQSKLNEKIWENQQLKEELKKQQLNNSQLIINEEIRREQREKHTNEEIELLYKMEEKVKEQWKKIEEKEHLLK